MSNKLTTEKFIEKANKIHGQIYDYSLVEYTSSHIKVKIICFEHGVFEQLATNHLSGYGCPNRAHKGTSTKKLTLENFIERANIVHNFYYNYNDVILINQATKIKIICPEHGIFEQNPNKHLSGSGCPNYSHRNFEKLSLQEFIKRAQVLYGDLYDYSKVNFTSTNDKIEIICKTHGVFWQILSDHLSGHKCQQCSNVYRRTTQDFIQDAREIHGNKYNYDLVDFITTTTPIIIICSIHGQFQQIPSAHLIGNGCFQCGIEIKRYSKEEFVEKAIAAHNNYYDYSLVDYINAQNKVIIVCPKHGQFGQSPSNHLFGHGCIKCKSSVSKIEKIWLDYLQIPENYRQAILKIDEKTYKLDAYNPTTNTIYEFYGDYWHGNPNVFDKKILHPLKNITYGELFNKTMERESLLKKAGYNIVSIWEDDFMKLLTETT